MLPKEHPTTEIDWRNRPYVYNRFHFDVALAAIIILILIGIGFELLVDKDGYRTNLYTEIISTAVTIMIVNRFAEKREQRQREQFHKEDIIRRLRSSVNEIAKHAALEFAENDAWKNCLVGLDLGMANLRDADLSEFDLRETFLGVTNLENAYLFGTDLRGAILVEANLKGARLNVSDWNYDGVQSGENLARLYAADYRMDVPEFMRRFKIGSFEELESAVRQNAIFDEYTILPDKTYWSPSVDMRRFTDPNFVDENGQNAFWRSDNPLCPAYENKENSTEISPH